jgi:cell division septation protein DedD
MEESLKARLIGAVVLVALAVLLIPELLSGRKPAEPVAEEAAGPRGTRSFTIELGQAPGQATRSPMTSAAPAPSAAESSAAPAAATAGTGAEPPAEPAASPDREPTAAPAPGPARVAQGAQSSPSSVETAPPAPPRAEAKPPPGPSAPGAGWAVQVGAFGSADTARRLSQDLGGAGYRAFVSPVNRGGRTLYRVRVGPVDDRAGAEQLVPRLKARGLPATVVRND